MAEILTQEEIDMLLDDGEPIKCKNVSKRIEDIKNRYVLFNYEYDKWCGDRKIEDLLYYNRVYNNIMKLVIRYSTVMKIKSEDEDKENIQIYYTRCNNKIRVDYNFNKFKTSEFITIFGEKFFNKIEDNEFIKYANVNDFYNVSSNTLYNINRSNVDIDTEDPLYKMLCEFVNTNAIDNYMSRGILDFDIMGSKAMSEHIIKTILIPIYIVKQLLGVNITKNDLYVDTDENKLTYYVKVKKDFTLYISFDKRANVNNIDINTDTIFNNLNCKTLLDIYLYTLIYRIHNDLIYPFYLDLIKLSHTNILDLAIEYYKDYVKSDSVFEEESIYTNNNGKIRTLKEIFDKNLPKLFKLLAIGDMCKSGNNLIEDANTLFNAITVNILNAYFKEKEKNE